MTGERPLIVVRMPWLDCPDCETNPASMVGDEIVAEGCDVAESTLEACICRHLDLS